MTRPRAPKPGAPDGAGAAAVLEARWGLWASVVVQTSPVGMAVLDEAATDPLTGLPNRRGWRDRTTTLRGSAGATVTIAVLDLDHFKAYNDAHRHQAGDRLLRSFAAAAGVLLRTEDVLARWGGEEFALALPGLAGGHTTAFLAELAQVIPDGQTFCAGHTVMGPGESVADAWDRADTLLYTAKRDGRARIVTDQT